MAAWSQRRRRQARGTSPRRGSRALLLFWGGFAGIFLAGIGVLQFLGPPPVFLPAGAIHHGAVTAAKPAPATASHAAPVKAEISPPQPALLAPSASNSGWLVPRIGAGGMTPMRAYAAGSVAAPMPGAASASRLALIVAGIGDDDGESQAAVDTLPAAVSLALTPYGQHDGEIAALARAAGHETLLAIPMQESDPASENAGNEALVMAAPITENQPMLDWSLSRFQGYAGVTDAIGVTQGAGFMENPDARSWLLQEIADKGLFFIDARPGGAAPYAWSRAADVVIDPVGAPQKETAALGELAADAKVQGAALGILLNPAPLALRDLAAWAGGLAAQGIQLVPASALVLPPNAATSAP